ncbi:hypothetical protein TRFO_07904 [Tritrichomonas foetus]|uniref:protein-serine/threonine phosphatase n=1 Tax=Tritrichomonas foetus TaxID=1144522 RepID=A0A1J4JN66_9EUKA|nr:hypothetical protein TRFO_07904 [Tritrichomonas foetus]|eukprot:OHT00569.1 hypothetical protein TRFO_07904 [Tritrichomonas foetus]
MKSIDKILNYTNLQFSLFTRNFMIRSKAQLVFQQFQKLMDLPKCEVPLIGEKYSIPKFTEQTLKQLCHEFINIQSGSPAVVELPPPANPIGRSNESINQRKSKFNINNCQNDDFGANNSDESNSFNSGNLNSNGFESTNETINFMSVGGCGFGDITVTSGVKGNLHSLISFFILFGHPPFRKYAFMGDMVSTNGENSRGYPNDSLTKQNKSSIKGEKKDLFPDHNGQIGYQYDSITSSKSSDIIEKPIIQNFNDDQNECKGGNYSLEVWIFLMALKCVYPSHIYLFRGINEHFPTPSQSMFNSNYYRPQGLQSEVISQYSNQLWSDITLTFSYLPISMISADHLYFTNISNIEIFPQLNDLKNHYLPIPTQKISIQSFEISNEDISEFILENNLAGIIVCGQANKHCSHSSYSNIYHYNSVSSNNSSSENFSPNNCSDIISDAESESDWFSGNISEGSHSGSHSLNDFGYLDMKEDYYNDYPLSMLFFVSLSNENSQEATSVILSDETIEPVRFKLLSKPIDREKAIFLEISEMKKTSIPSSYHGIVRPHIKPQRGFFNLRDLPALSMMKTKPSSL